MYCRMFFRGIPAFFMQPMMRSHSRSESRNIRMPPLDRSTALRLLRHPARHRGAAQDRKPGTYGGQSAALPEDARDAILFGMALMVVGTVCFVTIPGPMLRVFSQDIRVIEIGRVGFHFVGMNFLPLVTSLTFPAVGSSLKSSLLTVIRTEVLFAPPWAISSPASA